SEPGERRDERLAEHRAQLGGVDRRLVLRRRVRGDESAAGGLDESDRDDVPAGDPRGVDDVLLERDGEERERHDEWTRLELPDRAAATGSAKQSIAGERSGWRADEHWLQLVVAASASMVSRIRHNESAAVRDG